MEPPSSSSSSSTSISAANDGGGGQAASHSPSKQSAGGGGGGLATAIQVLSPQDTSCSSTSSLSYHEQQQCSSYLPDLLPMQVHNQAQGKEQIEIFEVVYMTLNLVFQVPSIRLPPSCPLLPPPPPPPPSPSLASRLPSPTAAAAEEAAEEVRPRRSSPLRPTATGTAPPATAASCPSWRTCSP